MPESLIAHTRTSRPRISCCDGPGIDTARITARVGTSWHRGQATTFVRKLLGQLTGASICSAVRFLLFAWHWQPRGAGAGVIAAAAGPGAADREAKPSPGWKRWRLGDGQRPGCVMLEVAPGGHGGRGRGRGGRSSDAADRRAAIQPVGLHRFSAVACRSLHDVASSRAAMPGDRGSAVTLDNRG